jgi:hypothetical protein
LISLKSPSSTAPTLSSSRFSAMPNTPCGNSSISPAIARSMPCTREMPSPIAMTVPTSATSTVARIAADLVANEFGDFVGSDVHVCPSVACA